MEPITLIVLGFVVLVVLGQNSVSTPSSTTSSNASNNALGLGLQAVAKALTAGSSSSGSSKGSGGSGAGSGGSGGGSGSGSGPAKGSTSPTLSTNTNGDDYNSAAAIDAYNANLQNMGQGDNEITYNSPGSNDVLTPDQSVQAIDQNGLYMTQDQIDAAEAAAGWGASGGGGGDDQTWGNVDETEDWNL